MKFLLFLLIIILKRCDAVIYYLNETEYDRMPPIFGLEGNYEKCLNQEGGLYCLAKFDLAEGSNKELFNIITEYSQHEIKHFNHSYVMQGLCVTQTCKKFISNKDLRKTAELSTTLEGCLNETIWNEYGLEAKLSFIFSCNEKTSNSLRMDHWDWILFAILAFFLVMNLTGSIYDMLFITAHHTTNDRVANPYLLSFSIFRNWNKLINTDIEPSLDRLRGFHGLKSVITFFVVSSHIMIVVANFIDNPRDFENSHSRPHYQVIFSGMVIVQIFFVMSGCLLVFNLLHLQDQRPMSWKRLASMLFFRWARLTPTNALVVFFMASWMRHLGSGPLWGLHVHSVANDCRAHWWKHLLYFNNYVKEDKLCAIHFWHIASEMQLFAVGAVLAVGARGRRLALGGAGLALLGLLAPPLHVWLQDLDALVLHRPEFYRMFENDTYRSMHVLGHNNLACYLIGMALGHVCHYCIKNNTQYPNYKVLKYLTWCVPAAMVGIFLSGGLFYVDGDRPAAWIRMVYAALHRPVFGLVVAFLLLSLVMKFEDVYRGILEWRGWTVTSRLSYAVFAVHFIFVHIMLALPRQLGHITFLYMVVYHFGVVFISLLSAVPLYLIVEAPVITVMKMLLHSSSSERNKKIT